jgi:hypothetical protein
MSVNISTASSGTSIRIAVGAAHGTGTGAAPSEALATPAARARQNPPLTAWRVRRRAGVVSDHRACRTTPTASGRKRAHRSLDTGGGFQSLPGGAEKPHGRRGPHHRAVAEQSRLTRGVADVLLRLGEPAALQLLVDRGVEHLHRQQFRFAGHPGVDELQQLPGERGELLTFRREWGLVAGAGREHVQTVDLDLPRGLLDGLLVGHVGPGVGHVQIRCRAAAVAAIQDDDLGAGAAAQDQPGELVEPYGLPRVLSHGLPQAQAEITGLAQDPVPGEIHEQQIPGLPGGLPQRRQNLVMAGRIKDADTVPAIEPGICRIGQAIP